MTGPGETTALDRTRPPRPGPIRPYHFPTFDRRPLPGGLELVAAPADRAPLVCLQVTAPAGAGAEGPGEAGLATLAAGLLDEGTHDANALEIAATIERLGGRLATGADWNLGYAYARLLARFADRGLALLADVTRRPTFPDDEVERARRRRLTDLLRRRDQPGALASDHFLRLLYGAGPYGSPLGGTRASVTGLSRDDFEGFWERRWRPAGSTLLAVGDLDPDALHRAAAEVFGPLVDADGPRPSPPAPRLEAPDRRSGVRVRVIDRPGAPQTELRLGHPGPPRTDPDWTPLVLLAALLGGKFTSRLNLSLRERWGFTYGVSSRFSARLGPGPLAISSALANRGVGRAVREILGQLRRLQDEAVPVEELADTKSYLLGVFPYRLQTVDGVLAALENLVVFDLPDDHYQPERYLERLEAVDPETLRGAARRHLAPDDVTVVAVGPADELVPQLEGLGALEVLSATEA